MTELEKFIKTLRKQFLGSKMGSSIGDVIKFVYLKKEYVVVNLEQLNLSYCEKFIEPNPEQYYLSFIRFCGPAMPWPIDSPNLALSFPITIAR